MKLLVIGASGHCGQWVTRLAVERGHEVTAFVRPTTPFVAPDGVRTVRGQVMDPADLQPAVHGHDAILSCVGPQRVTPANPFSPLKSPPHFCERSAHNIVAAARGAGVRRVGAISAAGVADSEPRIPWLMRWLLRHSTVGVMYADLGKMEAVYAASGIEWFAVRPVTLVNSRPTGRTREVEFFGMTSRIGRADVAGYMLAMLDAAPPATGRVPFIAWG